MTKDSFGNEVKVGDYLVFAVKSRYLGTLGIGCVTKISPKGSVSMMAIKSFGKTLEEARQDRLEWYDNYLAQCAVKGIHPSDWAEKHRDEGVTPYKTTLADASTCYKVPPQAVPMEIAQLIQVEVK